MDFPRIVGTSALDDLLPGTDRTVGGNTVSKSIQDVASSRDWTTPHAFRSRNAMGDLVDLPAELFKACVARLPIVDVTAMRMTCRGMAAIFTDATSPYAPLMTMMTRAWRDDVDDAVLLSIIKEIASTPLETRAQTIRTAACVAKVSPASGATESMAPGAWAGLIEQTREQCLEKVSANDAARMVADLDVAAWHVLDLDEPTALRAFRSACWARLQNIPKRYWPDVLDAAVSRRHSLSWLDVVGLVANPSISFPCMSDRLVIAFAKVAAPTFGEDLYRVMQDRFGVTRSQYVALLRPFEANRIEQIRWMENQTFAEIWRRYGPSDPALVELTETFAIRREFATFCLNGVVDEPVGNRRRRLNGDPDAQREASRWDAKFATFLSLVESDAIRSVEQSGTDATANGQSMIDALRTINWLQHGLLTKRAYFESILTMPQGYQPVVMERWATFRSSASDDPEHVDLLKSVLQWREAIVDQFLARKEYANAVRACVAELHAHLNLASGNPDALRHAVTSVTPIVFGMTPNDTWGPMLAFLLSLSTANGARPVVKPKTLTAWTAAFLRNPTSRFIQEPKDYLSFCKIAGPIFAELPDRKENGVSKFDHFCNRLSIPLDMRPLVMEVIAASLVKKIPRETLHLRSAIRETLRDADLLCDASFQQALFDRRIKVGPTVVLGDDAQRQ